MSAQATDELAMSSSKSYIGFWTYLMTDCVLFATLFATYIVLRNNTYGGPSGYQLFELPFVLVETLLLLTSSFTCGLAVISARAGYRKFALIGLAVTFLLGIAFLGMELSEFAKFVSEGNSWSRSGFLSAFFTLVGTHGLHITIGLLWLVVLAVYAVRKGLSEMVVRRLTLFSLFWHFLDVIWIFIFTIVYLFGVAV
jgi:cytochrome o ubiquinol oxidase subunit III